MSVQHLMQMMHRLGCSVPPPEVVDQDFYRSMSPAAKVTLFLRFETEGGPRTVIAPAVPLATASDITREMLRVGHYARFIDHLPALILPERAQGLCADVAFAKAFGAAEGDAATDQKSRYGKFPYMSSGA